jgi:peptidyl-prolyl cis-trans isomerase A (cyclophilin A)
MSKLTASKPTASKLMLSATLLFFSIAAGCGGETTEAPAEEAAAEKAEKAPAKGKAPSDAKSPRPDAVVDIGPLAPSKATLTAPDKYRIKFETTEGDVIVAVTREWAPNGADRLYNLIEMGYFTDIAFYRVIDNFMAQFGMHPRPEVNAAWKGAQIKDDPVTQSNTRGMMTFATAGPNTRTTQFFINFKDNSNLDKMGFSPVGEVVSGMEVVDALYKDYGEGAPRGRGPAQPKMHKLGKKYLDENFPDLDYIKTASILKK